MQNIRKTLTRFYSFSTYFNMLGWKRRPGYEVLYKRSANPS